MRILFVTNYYPPFEVGGYEQLCRDVAMRMAERGHTITVLTSDRGVERASWSDEPNVLRLLRTQPRPNSRLGTAAQFAFTRRRIETFNRQALRAVIEQFCPDVTFIWNLQGLPYELALDAELTAGVATAYWLAGYSPAEPDLFWRYWSQPPGKWAALSAVKRLLSRFAMWQMRREGKPVRPRMSHVAVVSEYMRRKGLEEGTLPPHTEVIYNGVETDVFFRPVPLPDTSAPITLLVAGRVSADKGIHVAVEAVGKLAQNCSQRDFRLVIAGNGPVEYLAHLQRLAESYGILDKLSFLGWLPRERLPELMHACHVLVLPSIYPEAFARVILEAMASGLAVVGTSVGGTGEIVKHEVTGLACAASDSADLGRQVGRLLDDPELRYDLATQAQRIVLERYSLDYMVQQLEALLGQAIAEQNTESMSLSSGRIRNG